ncbi:MULTISPECIES: ParA family protein [Cyanophyceae]|uniref:ParA family protein n=1 Tax=Cyanophyceae TaxID=3028117 RepID=UPI001688A490|nr:MULTISPECIES: ParA family protein [Cyanophyceae]MBD1914441.1 ParA family protein [Phormidium sp. FACHB-77]MBD2028850.1 ParA family protein [Phormidium sp. FACHB-322]MBD2049212.1 ParA family protein [Leptolyngbya sp. FACHB-60]
MIITVAGFKGGVGKTTTAVHLACYFAQQSDKTLLVDGDPNRSSLSWSKRGTLPFQVCDLMSAAKASRGKEHVIVDTEAHPDEDELQALAEGCDLLVLPSTPDALALEALLSTVDNLQNLTSYGVALTMVDSRKKGTATQAKETLNRLSIPVFNQMIRRLTAYEKAALAGVPVYETGDRFGRIAWGEYESLAKEIESHA